LGKSEKLGLRMETARIQYVLGEALRLGGNSNEAVNHYRRAKTLLEEAKKDPGAEHLLERADLKTMYAEAERWSGAAKS
jgi:hypothetical protein